MDLISDVTEKLWWLVTWLAKNSRLEVFQTREAREIRWLIQLIFRCFNLRHFSVWLGQPNNHRVYATTMRTRYECLLPKSKHAHQPSACCEYPQSARSQASATIRTSKGSGRGGRADTLERVLRSSCLDTVDCRTPLHVSVHDWRSLGEAGGLGSLEIPEILGECKLFTASGVTTSYYQHPEYNFTPDIISVLLHNSKTPKENPTSFVRIVDPIWAKLTWSWIWLSLIFNMNGTQVSTLSDNIPRHGKLLLKCST